MDVNRNLKCVFAQKFAIIYVFQISLLCILTRLVNLSSFFNMKKFQSFDQENKLGQFLLIKITGRASTIDTLSRTSADVVK